MKHKKLIIALCTVLIIVAACVYIFVMPRVNSDKNTIPRRYSKVSLPNSLQLKDQHWEDNNALDPAIHSAWEYTYGFQNGTEPKQVANEIEKTLKAQGFAVTQGFDTHSSNQFSINAKNSDLELSILVGYDVSEIDKGPARGDEVLVEAKIPY